MAHHEMEELAAWASKFVVPKGQRKEASEVYMDAPSQGDTPKLFDTSTMYSMIDLLNGLSRVSDGDMTKFKELVTGLYTQFVSNKKE